MPVMGPKKRMRVRVYGYHRVIAVGIGKRCPRARGEKQRKKGVNVREATHVAFVLYCSIIHATRHAIHKNPYSLMPVSDTVSSVKYQSVRYRAQSSKDVK